MIDGSEKRNRQLAFEFQNSHVCEKRSNHSNKVGPLLSSSITFNLLERNSRVLEGVANCLLKLARQVTVGEKVKGHFHPTAKKDMSTTHWMTDWH